MPINNRTLSRLSWEFGIDRAVVGRRTYLTSCEHDAHRENGGIAGRETCHRAAGHALSATLAWLVLSRKRPRGPYRKRSL
jgi:hypothetical protein